MAPLDRRRFMVTLLFVGSVFGFLSATVLFAVFDIRLHRRTYDEDKSSRDVVNFVKLNRTSRQVFVNVARSGGGTSARFVKTECPPVSDGELVAKMGPAFNARYMSVELPRSEPEVRRKQKQMSQWDLDDEDMVGDEDVGNGRAVTELPFDVDPHYWRIVGANIDDDNNATVDRSQNSQQQQQDYRRQELPKRRHEFALKRKLHEHQLKSQSRTSSTAIGTSKRSHHYRSKRKLHPQPDKSDMVQMWNCESRESWVDLGQNYFPRYQRLIECVEKPCWFNYYKCKGRAFTIKLLHRATDSCLLPVDDDGNQESNASPALLREEWVFVEKAVTFCCQCSA